MPRRQFDPSEHVEYMPPEFTREQKMMYPEEDDDYYDDEGLPVRLSDDIIMRAHYLDLGMSRLLQKYREGSLSDQEYIQFHRMNGELRSILQHVWNIGKRSLALWVQGHLRGGNPAYDIGIQNVEQLIDTFRSLDLPARPALTVMEQAMGYDMEDDLKRYAIGAPPLWGDYEYEDPEEQEQFDQALERAGFDDIDEVEPSDDDIWNFIEEQMEYWEDPSEADEFRRNPYSTEGPRTPMRKRKVAPGILDAKDPETFLNDDEERDDEERDDEEFSSYHKGYVNEENWSQPSPHVRAYGDLRRHPQYEAAIDDFMATRWDPINDMVAHRELLRELDIDEERWQSLDTQTQMALISRLMQAQHRTGNILTDYTPSFDFSSGRYEPQGDWVGWNMGESPSLESKAVREMLDDLNQSQMVESWDRMMERFPHERWAVKMPMTEMTRMAADLDLRGQPDLADRMDKLAWQAIDPSNRQESWNDRVLREYEESKNLEPVDVATLGKVVDDQAEAALTDREWHEYYQDLGCDLDEAILLLRVGYKWPMAAVIRRVNMEFGTTLTAAQADSIMRTYIKNNPDVAEEYGIVKKKRRTGEERLQDAAKALEMYVSGQTLNQIGQTLQTSPSNVRKMLLTKLNPDQTAILNSFIDRQRSQGIRTVGPDQKTVDLIDRIGKMHETGSDPTEIADVIGRELRRPITRQYVVELLAQYRAMGGAERPRSQPKPRVSRKRRESLPSDAV